MGTIGDRRWPTWVEIDFDRFRSNLESIRETVGRNVAVLLTVKADAYGHGAVQITREAEGLVDYFGVATVEEGLELRSGATKKPILVLSPVFEDGAAICMRHGFAFSACSLDFARRVSSTATRDGRTAEIHVEVDTGMGRTGVAPEVAPDFVRSLASLPGVRVGGVFTHFPVSESDAEFTQKQIAEFLDTVRRIEGSGTDVPLLHAANSGAVIGVPGSFLGMVRPGLMAYGHSPGGATSYPVRPILAWKARVAQLRDLPLGATVSYGRTFRTKRPTRMAVIPVGYGHGYPFQLSNKGVVLIAGSRAPIIGRVTMDMTLVDVTDVEGAVEVGSEVVLAGEQGSDEITIEQIAVWSDTISYDVLCRISKRVPRVYHRRGRVELTKTLLGVSSDATAS